jgi:hypothetical protein
MDIDEATRELVVRLNRHVDYGGQWCRKLDSYYHGRQPLAMLPQNILDDCGDRLPTLRVNFCQLAIDAIEERLNISGFRLPGEEPGSSKCWEIWQRNNLDEYSQQAHLDALIHGRAFLLVWGGPDGTPRITVESARLCTVWTMPGNPHRIAGLKRWINEDGRAFCTLFLPNVILKFQSPAKISLDPYLTEAQLFSSYSGYNPFEWWDYSQIPSTGWELRADPIPNPLGVVPLIPLTNRPRLLNWGESELIPCLPLVDAINKLATDMLISSEYFATPRRYATGIEVQTKVDPATGEEVVIDPFSKQKGRNWLAESPDSRFGVFEGATLSNFTDAILSITGQIGALMSLPPHYLGAGPFESSADAIRSSEAPLVSKCRRKQRAFGLGWEECMRLALMIAEGYRRPDLAMLETVWASPETRGIAAEADAAVKEVQMGLPLSQVAEDRLDMSPQQIEQAEDIQQRERADVAAQSIITQGAPPPAWETSREVRRNGEVAQR